MPRILGIDLGPDSLRGVLVRTSMRRTEVERYIQIPLTERPDSPGRLPELREAVENLTKAAGRPPDAVAASIGGTRATIRKMQLPVAAAKRIDEILPFELEALLPFHAEETAIDHQPIETRDGELHVLVAGVLDEQLRGAIADFEAAGIQARDVVVGPIGLEGVALLDPELAELSAVMVIELAHDHTDLCFLHEGRCAFARTLSSGLASLPADADSLITAIKRTIASYRASGGAAPERIVTCGQGAVAEGSRAWLAHHLESDVTPVRLPAATMESAPPSALFGRAAALAARSGAPGRHLNLRRGAHALQTRGGSLQDHVNLLVTCAVVIVLAAMFSLKARQSLLLDEQEALQTQLAGATKQILGRATSDPAKVQKLIDDPDKSDPLPGFDAFDAMAALSASVPAEVKHDIRRLRIDVADEKHEGRMELQGSLASLEQREALVSRLEEHPCFKDIDRGKTTPARGQDVVNYQLEAVVQCPGDEPPGKKKSKRSKE